MRILLALTFGMHLLLGNIVLGEIALMTPAPFEVPMSMTMAPALTCEGAGKSTCPTDRCISMHDDDGQPEETLLGFSPVSDPPQGVSPASDYAYVGEGDSFFLFTWQGKNGGTLALSIVDVVLRV